MALTLKDKIFQKLTLIQKSKFKYFRKSHLKPPYQVTIEGKDISIEAIDSIGSQDAFWEIVVEDCYNIIKDIYNVEAKLILDIGANVGIYSSIVSNLFEQAEIYAYEPNPNIFQFTYKNSINHKFNAINSAVFTYSGEINLDAPNDSTGGTIGNQEGGIRVSCINFNEILPDKKIDIMKLDCEGSEWELFEKTNLLQRTKLLRMEYHLYNGRNLTDLIKLVEGSKHKVESIKEIGHFGILHSSNSNL